MSGIHEPEREQEERDEVLDEQVRLAFEGMSLPPHRLRALVRQAERSRRPAAERWGMGGLVVLAAVLALALVVWPASTPPGQATETSPTPNPATPNPATPNPTPSVPPPPVDDPAPVVPSAPVELQIRSDRAALVYLDDQIQGYTPQDLRVEAGRHEVRAMLPGVPDSEQQKVVEASGAPIVVAFTFRAPGSIPEPGLRALPHPRSASPARAGVWLGATQPKGLALKITILQADDGAVAGTVMLQSEDGTFVEHDLAGSIDGDGALVLRGGGMTFVGRIQGNRASGTYTTHPRGPSSVWSAVRG